MIYLHASYWLLPWGSSIYARVIAYNAIGDSAVSSVGNGAVILSTPSAPLSLAEVVASRGTTQIGLSWTMPADEGGSPVIDYEIWIRELTNPTFTLLSPNSVALSKIATSLTTGSFYELKVRARNLIGLGSFSTAF